MLKRIRPIAPWPLQVGGGVSRRSCLLGWLLVATGLTAMDLTAWSTRADGDATEAKVIAQVQDAAKKAGLQPFKKSVTEHFLALGDGPDLYRESALKICEDFSKAFLSYFQSKGIKLALPKARLTVITLKDDNSFRKFIGADPGADVGGHYDLETNQLVIFDFRDKQEDKPGNPVRVNLFGLIHETAHMLCFNTGLLSRQADVPDCISEGLATFVEMWDPKAKARTPLSAVNQARLGVLDAASDGPERWIPIAELLADNTKIQEAKSRQLAYAESWLLVHFLIKTPTRLPRFQAYLAGLPVGDQTAEQRLKYAEQHLGSLKKLDSDLQRYARSLRRK
jgi:hypothetical protein